MASTTTATKTKVVANITDKQRKDLEMIQKKFQMTTAAMAAEAKYKSLDSYL